MKKLTLTTIVLVTGLFANCITSQVIEDREVSKLVEYVKNDLNYNACIQSDIVISLIINTKIECNDKKISEISDSLIEDTKKIKNKVCR